jgi:hypothetical protein
VPGIALLAIQKGPRTDQTGTWFGRSPLLNLEAEIADSDDTMAILQNLDLLVTVDTSVVHPARAIVRPVWIMLPRAGLALTARTWRHARLSDGTAVHTVGGVALE